MLRHKKPSTSQELWSARKQREEEERVANLPPGLINHGNTCFMNSTLQGLIATPLLHSLVNFEQTSLPSSSNLISPRRSPQLTNGHGQGGQYEQQWEQGMPLGDVFVSMLQRAWKVQESHKRESMSPKDLLTTIGRKYDQYMDFRQQDAHEFLRHMLDAMRMEELDIIKKRQPPPPKPKRRRTKNNVRSHHPDHQDEEVNDEPPPIPEEERLQSFVDMLFGGSLASILVCDTCKKISVTYEDFNDLSLSIKPEDYVKERKRDRFKHLAKKLRLRPKELDLSGSLQTNAPTQRSASVPASPARRSVDPAPLHDIEPPMDVDHRRRSLDHSTTGNDADDDEAKDTVPSLTPGTQVIGETMVPSAVVTDDESANPELLEEKAAKSANHVGFVDSVDDKDKSDVEGKKDKSDAWGKLGRRISVSMGMSKRMSRPKERGLRTRNAKDSEDSRAPSEERPPSRSSTPRLPISGPVELNREWGSQPDVSRNRSTTSSPVLSALSSPAMHVTGAFPNIRRHSALSLIDKKTKIPAVPKPPKTSRQGTAYLNRLLSDVHPNSTSAFSIFQQALSGQHNGTPMSAQALLMKLGHLPGIEECLRLFTSVEVLDGENMVGCHRCWKIANGTYKPRRQETHDDDSEEGSQDSPIVISAEDVRPDLDRQESRDSSPDVPGNISPASTPIISGSAASSSLYLHDNASVSSAPTTIQSVSSAPKPAPLPLVANISGPLMSPPVPSPEVHVDSYGGLPIPSISTTAPDTPTSTPNTARPPTVETPLPTEPSAGSLQPPRFKKRRSSPRRNSDAEDSSDGTDDEGYDSATDASADGSAYSDASSVASPNASPAASPNTSVEKLRDSEPFAQKNGVDEGRGQVKRIPKSEQVILRRTYKRYLIATPPPILVVHLKRFQQVSKSPYSMPFSSGFKKLDDFVAFPEYLDVAPFLAPKREDFGLGGKRSSKDKQKPKEAQCMYRLYAVVVHIGNMLGGHYIAYTALPQSTTVTRSTSEPQTSASSNSSTSDTTSQSSSVPSGNPHPPKPSKHQRQWAYISDTVVRLTTLEEVLKAKAYICMYERI